MSTASPAYFLDADYSIRYMNDAAALLFELDNGSALSAAWNGRTLRDFINTFWDRIDNLSDVERNLQLQNEQIHNLQRLGQEWKVSRSNIERIVLNTNQYGRLHLQKTGVAVPNASQSGIRGWVVTFNVIGVDDKVRFERFSSSHADRIQGGVFQTPVDPPSKPRPPMKAPGPSGKVTRWISDGCKNPSFYIAGDYAEKQRCFEFSAEVMKGPGYGLTELRHLPKEFFDYKNNQYVMMRLPI